MGPLKIGHPKRKRSYSNHPFLGAKMLVSGRVVIRRVSFTTQPLTFPMSENNISLAWLRMGKVDIEIYRAPKGKDTLPTSIFLGRTVKLPACSRKNKKFPNWSCPKVLHKLWLEETCFLLVTYIYIYYAFLLDISFWKVKSHKKSTGNWCQRFEKVG